MSNTDTSGDVRRRRRRRLPTTRSLVAASLSLSALVMLSACASSGNSSSTAAASSSASASGLAQAKALLAQITKRPSSTGVTVKVGKPIPRGEHVAYISCGTPSCAQIGTVIRQATDMLGWTLTVFNTDGTPGTEKTAFDQAITEKVSAIMYNSINASTFATELPDLKADHIFLAAGSITDPVGPSTGIDFSVDTTAQTPRKGAAMAAWVAADANGPTSSVFINVPAYPVLTVMQNGYIAAMKTYCPSCKVYSLDIPTSALATGATGQIVSYLRAHPAVKYVVNSLDNLNVGLPAALSAAGLTDVKIGGEGPLATNLQYIRSGEEKFTLAYDYYEDSWEMVDAVARHEAGVPVLASVPPPMWLITKDNVPQTTADIFPVVVNMANEYKAIWGV
jgi:ribose transport system substrate-binding protein